MFAINLVGFALLCIGASLWFWIGRGIPWLKRLGFYFALPGFYLAILGIAEESWGRVVLLVLEVAAIISGAVMWAADPEGKRSNRGGHGAMLVVLGLIFFIGWIEDHGRRIGFEDGYEAALDDMAEMPVQRQIVELRKHRSEMRRAGDRAPQTPDHTLSPGGHDGDSGWH